MRYLLLSDIHGNLQAFEAVEKSFSKKKYDRIISLGDAVGYGADPNECVSKISALGAVDILGNHDAAVTGKTDLSNFNERAEIAARWTMEHLDASSYAYLNGLDYVYDCEDFTAVHGTLHEAEKFFYMSSAREAMRTFDIMKRNVCFVGHSHIPGVYILKKDGLFESKEKKVRIEKGVKYIINVGSVGQPRDGDNRASYCIFDAKKGEVEFFRVKYDIMTAQKRIIDAGLPATLAERLELGR